MSRSRIPLLVLFVVSVLEIPGCGPDGSGAKSTGNGETNTAATSATSGGSTASGRLSGNCCQLSAICGTCNCGSEIDSVAASGNEAACAQGLQEFTGCGAYGRRSAIAECEAEID